MTKTNGRYLPQSDADSSCAFNLGADARLRGARLTDNPYLDNAFAALWEQGWKHVSKTWGVDEKKRPVKGLAGVR